jgi:hypothetical protein
LPDLRVAIQLSHSKTQIAHDTRHFTAHERKGALKRVRRARARAACEGGRNETLTP